MKGPVKDNVMDNWFTAHKEGLRQIAERLVERRGFGIIGAELYQNVMDTEATECTIDLAKVPGRPLATLIVRDNDPTGFPDLSHAWTVFAPSLKKDDPGKAGRFNLGEKMVLAFCREATIHTTCGTVVFNERERRNHPRRKRPSGTEFSATIACTSDHYDQFIAYMQRLIVRPNLRLLVNGSLIGPRSPMRVFTTKLRTEIAGEGGALRATTRTCEVHVYEPRPGETPMLYELGIPVVETGDRWHYDVRQKVPLNVDRDNVTPAYLRDLRTAVLNEMHALITPDDTTAPWVNEATSDGACAPEAAERFRVLRFGERSLAAHPTNAEANAEAVAHGYTLIPARGLTRGQRENLYSAGTLRTSVQAFPLAGRNAYSDDPEAKPVRVIREDQWTPGMWAIHEYAAGVAWRLLGKTVVVRFVDEGAVPWIACYGRGHLLKTAELHFNVGKLGTQWFENGATEAVDDLILHELAHDFEGNHLSARYHEALTKLGARLKAAALRDPDWFTRYLPSAD